MYKTIHPPIVLKNNGKKLWKNKQGLTRQPWFYASELCIPIKRKKENQGMTLVKTRVLKNQGVTLVLSNNQGDYAYDIWISLFL
jgi:hypothetical protein